MAVRGPIRPETRLPLAAWMPLLDTLAEPVLLFDADGVVAFAKNYLAVGFKLDYVRTDGELSTYTPDFFVKDRAGDVWIVETKGREEIELPRKMARLAQWCAEASDASRAAGGPGYGFVYVDQERFDRHTPASWAELLSMFRAYQPAA